jgi:hypothetical protein
MEKTSDVVVRVVALAATIVALAGCGIVRADRIAALPPSELASASDAHLCQAMTFNGASHVASEVAKRGLGDCSNNAVQCKSAGFPATHPAHLQCRQLFMNEAAAAQARNNALMGMGATLMNQGAPRPIGPIPTTTTCRRVGAQVICNTF